MQHWYNRWRALWHPERFHGWGKTRSYFEGWYVKLVAPEARLALALIPGIAYDASGAGHAFVQVLDGTNCQATYHQFATREFRPLADRFEVAIGTNRFAYDGVELSLPELQGRLTFQQHYPWPSRWGAPGIMGWYAFVPFMECYHGVVSMDHTLAGTLTYRGQPIDFTGGRGYLEKDWGRSFPSSWIWMQSNHFPDHPGTSLMVSVARIPWLGSHFVGFLCGLLHEGVLYQLTTYSGASLHTAFAEKEVQLTLEQGKHRLEVTGIPGPGSELVSPLIGDMRGKINESLQARLVVRFYENGALRLDATGHPAGLEIAEKAAVELV